MSNKKFFPAAVLSLAVLFTACSADGAEVSETVSETISETATIVEATAAAETTSAASETTAEITTEATTAETEIIDTSGVEYMKEALQAEWKGYGGAAEMYAADLNGDGVKELFVRYLFGAMKDGFLYVYDVSDGMKKLYEISARSSMGNKLYTDENGIVHYIFWSEYVGSIWEENYAYFDVTYDSIKIPFYVDVHGWFDGGAHVFDDIIYKNCEFVPTNEMNRNFDSEKAELVGTFEYKDIQTAFEDGENNEVSEIVQKEVFEGMTYFSDVTDIYFGSSYNGDTKRYEIEWDFEYFWQEAAPKLAEVYCE